jgi:biotin operon repressor
VNKERIAALKELRSLKGAPISILATMFVAGRAVTQSELSRMLDYSRPTIIHHLKWLEYSGYIVRVAAQRWSLPRGQLQLPGFPTILPALESYPQVIHKPDESVKIFDSLGSTTTASEHKQGLIPCSSSSSRENCKKTLHFDPELVAAFRDAGIGRNMWPELAALRWMAPAYCRAHTMARQRDPDPQRRTVAFQIHRMRSGDPAPALCSECGEPDGRHAMDCPVYRDRYTTGEYAYLFSEKGKNDDGCSSS